MAALVGGNKYGGMKPKPPAKKKGTNYGINRKNGESYFISGNANRATEILNLLYKGDIDFASSRQLRQRALYMLWRSAFKLKSYAEEWAKKISIFINSKLDNKEKVKVYGGAYKDVVYYKGNAYTFSVVKHNGKKEVRNLYNVQREITKLDAYYRSRINVPLNKRDIYDQQFTHVDEDVNIAESLTVIMTKVPWCMNGTLGDYPFRIYSGVRWKRYIQLVYEYCRVLRKLQQMSIYHLDIKPDNLFVCGDDKGELFTFGDIEGLLTCQTVNCDDPKLAGAATYMYLPYDGASFGADKFFPHRDVFAMMRTLLETFYNMYYFNGKRDEIRRLTYDDKKHVLRDRKRAVGVSGPGEPITEDEVVYSQGKLKTLVENFAVVGKDKDFLKLYGVNRSTFQTEMQTMLFYMVNVMWQIDKLFYGMSELYMKNATSMTPIRSKITHIPAEVLRNSLTKIMTYATKLGAETKPTRNLYKNPSMKTLETLLKRGGGRGGKEVEEELKSKLKF